jgi:SsrA-binding protein
MSTKKNDEKSEQNTGSIAQNRRARHDYTLGETFEAGMVLTGTEVKALRLGSANIQDGYAAVINDEVFLHNIHISPFAQGNRHNHDPLRVRKLLLNKNEIHKLAVRVHERGLTLIPTRLYFNDKGRVKIEIALAKGRKKYDKRDIIDRESSRREIKQAKSKSRR